MCGLAAKRERERLLAGEGFGRFDDRTRRFPSRFPPQHLESIDRWANASAVFHVALRYRYVHSRGEPLAAAEQLATLPRSHSREAQTNGLSGNLGPHVEVLPPRTQAR